jgi:SNF2 family DNA or RNA helicase
VPVQFDVRRFSDDTRETLAWQIHESKSWKLPELTHWNYALCRVHARGWDEEVRLPSGEVVTRKVFDRPKPMCRKCAIHFRNHQQVSIAWLYFKKHALLADTMGSGKTTSAGGLVAMLLETGELSLMRDRSNRYGGMGRVVIVPRSPALHQWQAELQRMMPGLNILLAEGSAKERRQRYLQPWQVLLVGPEMLRMDIEQIERFDLSLVLTDDVDALRNPETATSLTLDKLGARGTYGLSPGTDRYVIMTGTPLQKKLPELHAIFDGVGGAKRLGSIETFMRRHVRTGIVEQFDEKEGRMKRKTVITGYKNLDIVKQQIAPLYLRRTADDLDDVTLPTIMPNDVFLDLYPAQRAKYTELKKGVLKIIREEGAQVKRPTALAQIHYGAAICAGLAALGEEDLPGTSVKMDWVIQQMTEGDLVGEKVVVFANLKNTVRALQNRFRAEKIGFVTVWGEEKSKQARHEAQERFWQDPNCKVLIGTKAIEQSLNLQVSRHLVNVDTILNPARMEQLAGRVRRDGSAYQHVYVHNLLTVKTQEAGYLPLLEREAALASHIWEENSQLFNALPPLALLQLIGQSG